jgi:hypothetical protein
VLDMSTRVLLDVKT